MQAGTIQVNILSPQFNRAVRLLGVGATFAFFAYLFLVGSVVYHVVERRSIERDIAELRSQVSELEFSYFDAKRSSYDYCSDKPRESR